ncbi:unnamed protein product [Prunus armeniaca]
MLMRDPIEERPEELPRRTIKATNTYGAYGQLVVEPPNDFISAVVYQQHPKEDGIYSLPMKSRFILKDRPTKALANLMCGCP